MPETSYSPTCCSKGRHPDAGCDSRVLKGRGARGARFAGVSEGDKADRSSWGRLISRLNDRDSAEGIIEGRENMYPIYQVHYLEEFVKRPPRDIRAIMVGDRIVAAIYRNSKHWKTNMALGGVAEPCPVTQEMEEMCIKAKHAVQGDIVGVDLMESEDRGWSVHEVNNTTEYKNTVRVCGVDIPSLMLEYALEERR